MRLSRQRWKQHLHVQHLFTCYPITVNMLFTSTTRVFPFGVFLFPRLSKDSDVFACFSISDFVVWIWLLVYTVYLPWQRRWWTRRLDFPTWRLKPCTGLFDSKSVESSRIKSFFLFFVTPFWATPIGFQVENFTILLLSSFLAACLKSLASLVHLQLENLETLWADH